MLFHTPEFLILMILTLGLYYFLPKMRLYILALADLVFYGVGGLGYLGLFLLISTCSYFLALKLKEPNKRFYLWLGIALNVFNLLFFKYTFFILGNLEKVFSLHLLNQIPIFQHLLLPIGISFYTFELIAYLVDVYHEKTEAPRSWLIFWVFISFFPHRVAGPIMRAKDLIPRISNLPSLDVSATVKLGLAYLSMGLFKKIVITDYLAASANNFFASGASLNSSAAWIAAYFYTFQIYYDFSAYSEMAVGIGYLFGIKLDLNFKTPYLSANATEFWKRWHITLSNWIRDYLYIPLGGSRLGISRKYINLFIAMAISGLWHGAAWTFVIWGMYHGMLLIIHNIYRQWNKPMFLQRFMGTRLYHALVVLLTFHLVCIGWVFFRVEGIHNALRMIFKMLTLNPLHLDSSLAGYLLVVVLLYLLHILERRGRENYLQLSNFWHKYFPAPVRALAYTAFIILLIISTQTQPSSYIYFKF
ncbi:MAG: MBOAT family O-acyltransferase [Syntrophomonas sp.]